jgi:hypothetical protein
MIDEDYIRRQAREELQRLEEARKRRLANSQQSFGDWLQNTITNIGRAIGQIVSVPIKVIGDIWNWLFG